ncbi:MAG: PKD domain-containing protein [Flavobacteriia bacterium]|nr:PKD domain-containing protein [Flavobacteriia bacterium]
MKNLFHKGIIIFLLSIISSSLFSQSDSTNWVQLMQDPSANFYDVQKAFYKYWDGRKIEKGKGYKQFKRWEAYMTPRVYPSGDMKLPSKSYEMFQEWEANQSLNNNSSKTPTSVWTPLGPVGTATGGGAGRVNFIRFDPATSNTIYVGTPDGGLWKSINGGTSWTTNTDQLTVIGCSDIAINPSNTQIMYLATGDGDAGDSYSTGVLKSTDGGATWNTTGLSWSVSAGVRISKLLIHPSNPTILIAATSNGIYRTADSGTTWTQTQSTASFKDIEFKPTDPNTVYAAGSTVYKSTNNGVSWTQITSGLPTSGIERFALAVTEANAAYVYILGGRSSDQGLLGVYRSTDSGTTYTTMKGPTGPNLLGYDANGGDVGGQAFYDLTIAASPTAANTVIVGGVNIWKSTDGGTNWVLNAQWTGTGAPYVHADQHDLVFLPGSGTTYFAGCDGGIFKTTNSGTAWSDISANLTISQQYRLNLSASTEGLLVTGHQDNGINKYSGGAWSQIFGGDGMDCFIDRTNNSIIYSSYVYGDYSRSTNGGSSWTSINSGIPAGDWLSVWHQDPTTATTIYAGGRAAIYKTTNSGTAWSALGTPTGTGNIIEFAIAPSNNTIIYAVKENAISKSTNSGTTWTNITGTLPTSSAFTNVVVHNTDPNIVWITISGYNAANKVYKSTNGGTSWTNISTGLPNVPCNTIVFQNGGANDPVYIGTDIGVYYKDNTSGTWVSYFNGLPRVSIRDLEIFYPTGKLRAATFGRGTWETGLMTTGSYPPTAEFTGQQSACQGATITYTDASAFTPTSWSWSITPGTAGTDWSYVGGTSSTSQNIQVQFNTNGIYTIALTATNVNGSNTITKSNYTTINANITQALPISEGFTSVTFPAINWTIINSNASTTWTRSSSVGNAPSAGNSMFFNNFNINDSGDNDEVRLPKAIFTGLSSAQLTFDVAYAPYDATNYDGLEIAVSTNCGGTFTNVYSKNNTTLATAAATTNAFTPTSAQWRTETIDLTAYIGQSSVIIAFRNVAGYGNNLYIDNINLTGVATPQAPVASFTTTNASICAGNSITFTNTSTNTPTSYSWTFTGGNPTTSTATNPTVVYSTAGNYNVSMTATNAQGSNTTTQTNYVTVNAVPSIPTITTSGSTTFCQGNNVVLTSSASTGNTWSTSASTPSITVTNSGNYTVTTSNGSCSSTSSSTTITVNPLPTISMTNFPMVCVYATPFTLTGATPSGGNYSGIGISANTFNPTVAGIGTHYITYNYTDPSTTCSKSDSATIVVDACLGLESMNSTTFDVFPNPSIGTLNVVSNNIQINNIIITDELGKIIKVIYPKNENQIETFSLNELAGGCYTLIFNTADFQKSIKYTLIK